MNPTIDNVTIVGGDAEAWLAAAALKRALAHRGVHITVVDTGPSADAVLAHWTLPSLRRLHTLIGIKESHLIAATGATFKLATQHTSWREDRSAFLHPHGEMGATVNGVPFYKWLLMQKLAGHALRAETYSLAAAAAERRRFAQPMDTNALTSSFTYALHLDEQTYAAYLREHALRLGVVRVTGALANIERHADGRVTALVLESGDCIGGDYFVDGSGPSALLMDRLDREREDWSKWLPNDRILTAIIPPDETLCAWTTTRAIAEGWCWRMPLQRHTSTGVVFDSARVTQSAAESELQAWAGVKLSDMRLAKLCAGRRRRFWVDNCIAVGSAAASIEPLAISPLHIVQLGISAFIELFPIDAHGRVEAVEYNRVLAEHVDSLRDFTLAHYLVSRSAHASRLSGEPALQRLTQRLEFFKSNGRIVTFDHETFEELDWAWVLLGNEYWPDTMELHARSNLHEAARPEAFDSMKSAIERLVSSMPLHRDYLRRLQ